MSVNKSIYEKFIIESADQERTADISSGVLAFTYFENIFSPFITARVIVTNTGGSIKGKDGVLQSIYNRLPLRGCEIVIIKIAWNSILNKGQTTVGLANCVLLADGKKIYSADSLKVGLFK